MKVTMKQFVSGTRNGAEWPAPGEQVDVPGAEADALIAAGIAEQASQPAPETAVAEPPENAAQKRPSRRKAG